MSRANRRMLFLAILIAPVTALLYLYSNNAMYLDFGQVLIVAAAMIAVSALGYGFFRLITRSSLSAFCGCLTLWIGFYLFAHVYEWLDMNLYSSMLYALLIAALSIVIAFLIKPRRGAVVPPIAVSMAAVIFFMNAIPAGQAAYALSKADPEASYKSDFAIDDTLPSPNVYWIHADGMLGFDAFETYFGDDQREFKAALTERGFEYNEDAYLETGHRTMVAIAALMSPHFYDSNLKDRLSTHELAMDSAWDSGFLYNELQTARTYNETRLAFEKKKYTSQTIADFKIYFPPVTNRFYVSYGNASGALLDLGDNPEAKFLAYARAGELTEMLFRKNITPALLEFMTYLMKWNLSDIRMEPLKHPLSDEETLRMLKGSADAKRIGATLSALNDALYTQSPTFNIVFYGTAHAPFLFDETGTLTGGDQRDLFNYPPQHRYAAKVLVEMIDLIVRNDPDAVIVIQADHGLHMQSRKRITEKLGEDAVLPIWNSVMSAIRVPENYKNGDENRAMDNPLNMARYLVNHFIGENYPYLD